MTDTVTEENKAEAPVEHTFSSPMEKMQFEGLEEFIAEYNQIVGQVNAAAGDKDALADQIAKEQFADELAEIQRLQEALDAKIDVEVEKALTSDKGDTTELTEKAKDLKGKIGAGINYFKKLYGDKSAERFTKQDRLKGQRVGGTGTGTRRIRGFRVTITDSENKAMEYENFATAAKALGLTTAELQEYFFAKAGATDLTEIGNEVVFRLEWENEDGEGNKTPDHAIVKAYREVPIEDAEDEAADEAATTGDDVVVDDDDSVVDEDGLVNLG
jgi:hypothetical protein